MPALRRKFATAASSSRLGWWIIFATLSGLDLSGAEVSAVVPSGDPAGPMSSGTNASLVQIGPGLFKLGEVLLDKNLRTVRFPAVVNLREGNIEYVVVTTSGKTHESIFKTEAQPLHIQLALLLLGARGNTNALPEDPTKPLPGNPIVVEVNWKAEAKAGSELRSFRAEHFVHDRRTQRVLAAGNWAYTGSRIREDGFAAQVDGSIVSLITDPDALINNPRPGREDDDNWLVRTNDLPALNIPVELILRLPEPSGSPEKKVR